MFTFFFICLLYEKSIARSDKALGNSQLLAIGGVAAKNSSRATMMCRAIFYHSVRLFDRPIECYSYFEEKKEEEKEISRQECLLPSAKKREK